MCLASRPRASHGCEVRHQLASARPRCRRAHDCEPCRSTAARRRASPPIGARQLLLCVSARGYAHRMGVKSRFGPLTQKAAPTALDARLRLVPPRRREGVVARCTTCPTCGTTRGQDTRGGVIARRTTCPTCGTDARGGGRQRATYHLSHLWNRYPGQPQSIKARPRGPACPRWWGTTALRGARGQAVHSISARTLLAPMGTSRRTRRSAPTGRTRAWRPCRAHVRLDASRR